MSTFWHIGTDLVILVYPYDELRIWETGELVGNCPSQHPDLVPVLKDL